MKDLNFFSEFILEKRRKNKSFTILVFVCLFVFGTAIGSTSFLQFKIKEVTKEVETNRSILSSKEYSQDNEKLDESIRQYNSLKKIKSDVESIAYYLEKKSYITSGNLAVLFNSLPEEVTLEAFAMKGKDFSLDCTANSRLDVYSAINNLKLKGMKDVEISSIVKVDMDGVIVQKFQISGTMGGVKYE